VTRELRLAGQTVVVIGGTSGIGLETARLARTEGADLIITARETERLHRVGREVAAKIAAFDVTDIHRLRRFFDGLPASFDHLLLSGGLSYSAPFAELDLDESRRTAEPRLWSPLQVARLAMGRIRPGGVLLFLGCRRELDPIAGPVNIALAAALAAMVGSLASELAPARVNLITSGFVDRMVSADLSGATRGARDEELDTLSIESRVEPRDAAALAVHVMTNEAITGATLEVHSRPATSRSPRGGR
jgi:NAD(P)-dependent dehydrogenase (short-subunit alcohol dehydrogenase family)